MTMSERSTTEKREREIMRTWTSTPFNARTGAAFPGARTGARPSTWDVGLRYNEGFPLGGHPKYVEVRESETDCAQT